MTEYKQINVKTIFVIMKVWNGGKIEFTDAYWDEAEARKEAVKQLPMGIDIFTIRLYTVNLHGSMVDKV